MELIPLLISGAVCATGGVIGAFAHRLFHSQRELRRTLGVVCEPQAKMVVQSRALAERIGIEFRDQNKRIAAIEAAPAASI